MQIRTATLILGLCAGPLVAQDSPLSAIDWLAVQRNVEPVVTVQPQTLETPVAQSAAVPLIEVLPLDTPSIGGVGLLPSAVTGLPTALWQGSAEADLIDALDRLHRKKPSVPALDSLMHTLLLAEASPPNGSAGEDLLHARLQTLYSHGLVAPAEALADRVGTFTPSLFKLAFDLALLTGSDEALCQLLTDQPGLSSDLPTRIWCATRSGDFPLAMTIYQTATVLGQLSELDTELLLRFLDPEYAEDIQPLRPPVRPTPLQFRLFEAIGEALPTTPLPLPFAVVELSGDSGWRAQLQAAERLARAGAIDGNQLLGVYTEQLRAASGGIWDRVEALQRFETALNTRDPGAVSSSLEMVWPQMRTAGLLVPFSNLFAARLQGLPLSPRGELISGLAGLLSDDYEIIAQALLTGDDADLAFLAKIARGDTTDVARSDVPHANALAQVWSSPPVAPDDLARMAQQNQLGEALLATLLKFEMGADGRAADLSEALQTLRAFGLEDTARRAALQLAILDMEGARR